MADKPLPELDKLVKGNACETEPSARRMTDEKIKCYRCLMEGQSSVLFSADKHTCHKGDEK